MRAGFARRCPAWRPATATLKKGSSFFLGAAPVLNLLDRISLADLSVSSSLLITRGELRATANRCAEGIGDFDLALAKSRRPPKPALLGRARCKQQLGDTAGARADFARYRREFPDDPLR